MALTAQGGTAYTPYDYDSAIRDRLSHIDNIGVSENNYVQEAAQRRMQQQAADQQTAQYNAAQQGASNAQSYASGGSTSNKSTGNVSYSLPAKGAKGNTLSAFLAAESAQESGGNYNARNASSGAMGKYQIMPGNIQGSGGWDKEALGYNISVSQFMASPALQEKIAQYKLGQYYNAYGPAGAAVAWYAGPGAVKSYMRGGGNGGQGSYPSIRNYANSILRKMGI